MADELDDWEAVAREQGGLAVYLERPDLPRDEEIDRPMLEPLILKVEEEGGDLVSVHLRDIAGNDRVMFLMKEFDLTLAPYDEEEREMLKEVTAGIRKRRGEAEQ